jgi:hypothetical protein
MEVELKIRRQKFTVSIEDSYNELLEELTVMVNWPKGIKFLMNYDLRKIGL